MDDATALGVEMRLLSPTPGSRSPCCGTNLPTNLLRSFLSIVEAGSMSRASSDVCLTQPTLSLQMKRLEQIVKTQLFDRHKGGLLLTPAGRTLVGYARAMLELNDRALSCLDGDRVGGSVRVGLIQDFTEVLLPKVLVRFSQRHPETQLQVSVSTSTDLRGMLEGGLLDVVLHLGPADDPSAVSVSPMVWLGQPRLCEAAVLPLILMEKPCIFRTAALAALEASGRPYAIVLETGSFTVLRAAVEGGLGVTCRTRELLGHRTPRLEELGSALPTVAYALHTGHNPQPATERLCRFLRQAVHELEEPGQVPAAPRFAV